ncbi:glycosyltransferase family 4 protein [Calothrix sp. PCC 7507]|uniref:glycosyltransferase family 4 protein n=1 Tax=Calothrix sp. PCC 7507 TaxID=99598 RepID=UPI00029F0136|nr:glycosyltransferase family 4 protein [Calothrix sp. PCC 7507]AFY32691.1 glycosyl transferase group 1 [Calothrix sp. PCC 7507]
MSKIKVVMLGPSLYEQGGMGTVESLIVKQTSKKVDFQHICTHEEGTILHRINVYAKALIQFLGKLISNDIDIVHMHVSEKGSVLRKVLLVLLSLLFRKPVIMHTHGCEFHLFYDSLPAYAKRWVSAIFQRCAYVITLSESWNKYYISTCNLATYRVGILYNPVELPVEVPLRVGVEKIRFVFLGRIGERKGAFDLIRAFANLSPEERRRTELTLAGDGEVEQARDLVKTLNLQDVIRIPGWINTQERDQLLRQSDVFILPSYNEGLPVAMLEAMAWELPVITTPVGGIPEIVTHQKHGILVNPGNIEQITKAMQILIKDESLRLAMGKSARQQVAPLSVQNYHNTLLTIYQSLIAGRGNYSGNNPSPTISNL